MNTITSAYQQLKLLHQEQKNTQNKKIKIADLSKPYPPNKPDIYYIKKPIYFEGIYFFKFFVITIFPAIIFCYWILDDHILKYGFLLSIILSFLGLLYNYLNELEVFEKSVKEKNRKLQWYENELNIYQKKIKTYDKQSEENRKNHIQNKNLNDKLNLIENQIVEILIYLYQNEVENKKMNIWLELGLEYEYHPLFVKFKNSQKNEVRYISGSESTHGNSSNQLKNLESKKQKYFVELLKKVERIQHSSLSSSQKADKIREILWTNQSTSGKLWVGAILGSLSGLAIFGTGGIGLAGLGGAVGIWGFLAGTAGGVLVSSVIQNYENTN